MLKAMLLAQQDLKIALQADRKCRKILIAYDLQKSIIFGVFATTSLAVG